MALLAEHYFVPTGIGYLQNTSAPSYTDLTNVNNILKITFANITTNLNQQSRLSFSCQSHSEGHPFLKF